MTFTNEELAAWLREELDLEFPPRATRTHESAGPRAQ